MNAVTRYRLNRIRRLEEKYGKYHGPKARFDDDEDQNENGGGGSKGGGHGNTRIPYGLCQREGIDIGKDWTPKDAWEALAGKGYSAAAVYKELKSSGKVPSKGASSAGIRKSKYSAEESAKIIKDFESKRDEVDSARAELEDTTKKKEKAQRAFKRHAGKVSSLTNSIRWHEKMYNLEELYGSDYAEYEKRRAERDQIYAELKKETEKSNKEYNKKSDLEKKESELADKIAKTEEERDAAKEKYHDLVKESPTYDKVKEYRGYEQEKAFLEESIAPIRKTAESQKAYAESYEASEKRYLAVLETLDKDSAWYKIKKEYADSYHKTAAEWWEKYAKTTEELKVYDGKLAELDRKMETTKKSVASEGEDAWNRSYDVHKDESLVPKVKPDRFADIDSSMSKSGVEYRRLEKYAKTPDNDAIISHIGGGDKTIGSCASVAFAYLANKAGYNVLDYRDGESRSIMSRACISIANKLGGKVESGTNDFNVAKTLLANVEEGKEYFFTAGRHAAIVRKKDGKMEYLELQDSSMNGWYGLTEGVLKRRFACQKSHTSYGTPHKIRQCLIEADKVMNDKEFISCMGYINTASDKQKKGKEGSVK